jgi:hypothetical protein
MAKLTITNVGLIPKVRSKFIWKDVDEIYLNAGFYHHVGTKEQMVYWDSQLTFQFTSLATSDWSYLYLDDSAIVTSETNLITVSELIDSLTEPTWNDAKKGWYNGEDKCIFAVLTDGSSNILEFFHSKDFVAYGNNIEDLAMTDIDLAWTDVTLTIPAFCRSAEVIFEGLYDSNAQAPKWRTNGSTEGGHQFMRLGSTSTRSINTLQVITDDTLKIEIVNTASDGSDLGVKTSGWYFPIGM